MVSYYNPTAVAMFGRSGSGYHHHHHSPPTQNHPYFAPGAYGTGYHHNPHSHHTGHQAAAAGGSGGSGSPVGTGLGAAGLPGGVTSAQFSPNMASDFNCNNHYNPHFGTMNPDSMAVAAAAAAAASPWATQSSMYSSACAAAAARNAAAVAVGLPPPPPPAPHGASYEEWSNAVSVSSGHHHPHPHMHPHAYQHHPPPHHPSFYNHHASVQQTSPPSSTPSSPSSSHSPSHHVYSTSNNTPNNTSNSNNNNSISFKTEFGPCSGGNNQEASSQEMQQTNQGNSTSVAAVTSAGPSIGTPHSPDSGMAISDGVSSSGSPATNNGQQFHQPQHCLGGPSSNSSGSSSTNQSSGANTGGNNGNNPGNNGSDKVDSKGVVYSQQQFGPVGGNMIHGMGSHHSHHGHLHNINSNHQTSGNLNHHHHHQSLVSHQNGIANVTSSGRPTQARSPYEWMKKPTYSCSSSGSNPSSNSAKTRTKDKYRVVYSDTQRLELEKEFHYSRYITIRRKAELASNLGLSERQVKIWFQNRRAKERKVQRKREEMLQREKLATMVHMQNAAVAAAGGMGGPMCNQPNAGGVPLSALM